MQPEENKQRPGKGVRWPGPFSDALLSAARKLTEGEKGDAYNNSYNIDPKTANGPDQAEPAKPFPARG